MRRMKRFTFVIILMLAVPISFYFLVFERPIKASPNELILSSDELPNWEFVQGSSSSDDAINYFHNSSVEVGYNLTIGSGLSVRQVPPTISSSRALILPNLRALR